MKSIFGEFEGHGNNIFDCGYESPQSQARDAGKAYNEKATAQWLAENKEVPLPDFDAMEKAHIQHMAWNDETPPTAPRTLIFPPGTYSEENLEIAKKLLGCDLIEDGELENCW